MNEAKETRSLQQQFLEPSDEYTPVPFWFWNDALTSEEIVNQIAGFAEKGVMGFVIHPRIGIPETIPYLSDKYMDLVETAVKEAKRLGMTVFLYDEAMYPSGSAKGMVVQNDPAFASRGLKMLELDGSKPIDLSDVLGTGDVLISAQAVSKKDDKSINPRATVIVEPKNGKIQSPADRETILLFIETFSKGTIRGIHFGEDDGEPNAPAAADLLNPLATQKFIRLTHQRYYERVGAYFGNTIQAMFTDEPDILGRRHVKGLKAWTGGFLACFTQEGCNETDLPLLWFEVDNSENVRRAYRKAVNKRMVDAYYKPLSDWCAEHGISLTGHPAASDDIGLLEHFQIPGQDVVWRWVAPEDGKALEGRHTTMAKCSSDAARHRGRRRNLNEFLGVCSPGGGWALNGGDMKWYMDWLLVRGVNLLCPHAFYYSVDGPRRFNERPPDVGPNNIWWPHYRLFSDYMKRMSWLMTDSVNNTPIAVLCREDWLPWQVVKPLYENQREFNYLEESLLVSASKIDNGCIQIKDQAYSVVLVENERLWEEETRKALQLFRDDGGIVIVLHTDKQEQDLVATTRITAPEQLISALDEVIQRPVILDPPCVDLRVSHVVKEGHHFYVVVHEGEQAYEGTMTVETTGRTERWDPWECSIGTTDAHTSNGRTTIPVRLERRQSIVYSIDPSVQQHEESNTVNAERSDLDKTVRSLTDGWMVDASQLQAAALITGLGSWSDIDGLEHLSGTVHYANNFVVESEGSQEAAPIVLDLGEAHEMAEVWVNGQFAGVRMWHPYTFNIESFIQPGDNELRIAVTNSLANRIDQVMLPSGLIGPVSVSEYRM
ncbi:glycosylhydrolase-like jelly roll fold domain-containing protein [Paenibacillus sp. UNC451MF]|uniref:glycosylhydrolase-like jelly roll fold domain-containing protein n=1 Tax=Paenibacillus sp. UNC451MF TaxID=1449063 RepID=UPI00055D0181|nr:glycosylhydrolase-like jelly roll fold domain-containing protein [Paenibacillus sp. UNC451MF]